MYPAVSLSDFSRDLIDFGTPPTTPLAFIADGTVASLTNLFIAVAVAFTCAACALIMLGGDLGNFTLPMTRA